MPLPNYTPRYPNSQQFTALEAETEVVANTRFVRNAAAANVVIPVSASNATSMDCSKGDVFTYVPTENTTITAKNIAPGQRVSIQFTTSGTSSFTITFGTGFLTTGTLATGTTSAKVFVVCFEADPSGTSLKETSRTTAM